MKPHEDRALVAAEPLGSAITHLLPGGEVADVLAAELAAMTPDAERFDARTTVLIENVTHHMDEEERDWFPTVGAGLSREQPQDLGARMMELKKTAPTRPAQPSAVKKAIDAVIT